MFLRSTKYHQQNRTPLRRFRKTKTDVVGSADCSRFWRQPQQKTCRQRSTCGIGGWEVPNMMAVEGVGEMRCRQGVECHVTGNLVQCHANCHGELSFQAIWAREDQQGPGWCDLGVVIWRSFWRWRWELTEGGWWGRQRCQLVSCSHNPVASVPGTQSVTGKHMKAENDEHCEVVIELQNIETQFCIRVSACSGQSLNIKEHGWRWSV